MFVFIIIEDNRKHVLLADEGTSLGKLYQAWENLRENFSPSMSEAFEEFKRQNKIPSDLDWIKGKLWAHKTSLIFPNKGTMRAMEIAEQIRVWIDEKVKV